MERPSDWWLPEIIPGEDPPESSEGVQVMPVLSLDRYVSGELTLSALATACSAYQRVVLCVDEDSQAIKALSPRFADEASRKNAAQVIASAIRVLSVGHECLVALTIEELCPGGLDASDGIELAQLFVDAGAAAIIASGGTLDFPALKIRRPTQLKPERQTTREVWPETWLSSALWLVGRVRVPVYAQGIVSDLAHTLPAASRLGLAGVIDVSVKHPSSSLTMSKS